MAARMFSEDQLEQLRSFPDIGKDDLIRYFTLTPAAGGGGPAGRPNGSLRVIYEEKAIDQAAGFLADDPAGLGAMLDAVDGLAGDPARPNRSVRVAGLATAASRPVPGDV